MQSSDLNITHFNHAGFHFRGLRIDAATPTHQTIFYIGGAFQQLEDLARAKQPLTLNHNLVLVELPGFGVSDALPAHYDFSFYVDCIEQALSLCADDAVLAYGYSYGVGPLFKAVSRLKERFIGLVIASACASFSEPMLQSMRELIRVARAQPTDFPLSFEHVLCHPDVKALTQGRASALMIRRMLRSQPQAALERFAQNYERLLREHQAVDWVEQPVLGLIGEYDHFIAPRRIWGFTAYCASMEGHILQGCDHFFHLQRPDADVALVQGFLHRCLTATEQHAAG